MAQWVLIRNSNELATYVEGRQEEILIARKTHLDGNDLIGYVRVKDKVAYFNNLSSLVISQTYHVLEFGENFKWQRQTVLCQWPRNAFVAGYDADKNESYYLGKIEKENGGIMYGRVQGRYMYTVDIEGILKKTSTFQVLVLRSSPWSIIPLVCNLHSQEGPDPVNMGPTWQFFRVNEKKPENLVRCGRTNDEKDIFVARAWHLLHLLPGYAIGNAAYVAYDGEVFKKRRFEMLYGDNITFLPPENVTNNMIIEAGNLNDGTPLYAGGLYVDDVLYCGQLLYGHCIVGVNGQVVTNEGRRNYLILAQVGL
ncbi:Hypothetical predicted protein [Cloeon dipterum]|uniref:Uncharacterized protein n=1 Tax=Cloeon dipterum TaxID=197152 RepID=A0A8S1DEZ4_9INSE|nr:Hypothetical predicted protein [Cloeon dipterum]